MALLFVKSLRDSCRTTRCMHGSALISWRWPLRRSMEAPNSWKTHIWAEQECTQKARNLVNRSLTSRPLHWVISAGCTGVSGEQDALWLCWKCPLDSWPYFSFHHFFTLLVGETGVGVQLKCFIPSLLVWAHNMPTQRTNHRPLCVMWDFLLCKSDTGASVRRLAVCHPLVFWSVVKTADLWSLQHFVLENTTVSQESLFSLHGLSQPITILNMHPCSEACFWRLCLIRYTFDSL